MIASRLFFYLTERFLTAILIVFAICVTLILLVDFVEMVRRTSSIPNATTLRMLGLSILRLPSFTEQLFPFAVLFGTMATLLRMSQKLELVVIRAAGMSVWQFLTPGLFVALGIGVLGTFAYNPLAAKAREHADRIEAFLFGRNQNIAGSVQTTSSGAWIRQQGTDGQFIMNASSALNGGLELLGVAVHTFDGQGNFLSRLDASRALLKDGYWELVDTLLTSKEDTPERFQTYQLPTNLTPAQVRESFSSIQIISIYDLPEYITLSHQAGLPATHLRLQYQTLLARPWLLVGMALIAATVSLRLFRSGRILPLIMGGIGAGFLLYLTIEITKQLGRSGLIGVIPAAWVPVVVAMLTGFTILLYQEDG